MRIASASLLLLFLCGCTHNTQMSAGNSLGGFSAAEVAAITADIQARQHPRPPRDVLYGVVKNDDDRTVQIHFTQPGGDYATFILEPTGAEGLPLQAGTINVTTDSGRLVASAHTPRNLDSYDRVEKPRAFYFRLHRGSLRLVPARVGRKWHWRP